MSVTLLACSRCADSLVHPQTHNQPQLFQAAVLEAHRYFTAAIPWWLSRAVCELCWDAGWAEGRGHCLDVPDIQLGTTGTLSTESCSCLAFSLAST